MASVLPRKNPSGEITWRVQFRIDGQMRQETFPDSKSADSFGRLVDRLGGLAAREVLARRAGNVDTMPTLTEWTTKYLDPASGILTGITVGTRAGYRSSAASSFLRILGDLPVDTITGNDVGRWVEWQERQPSRRGVRPDAEPKPGAPLTAAKTVHNQHALLSNILKAAVTHKLATENPAHRTRLSEGLAREPVFLSRDEFQALYEQIPGFYQPLVAFLVGSQCRWSEATALNVTDVNRDTIPPTVRVSKAWKKNPDGAPTIGVTKTKRGRRTIALWDELVNLLDTTPGLLFKGKEGDRIWYGMFNTRIWKPAIKRAGLERVPNIHDLRHTGASWLIADGMPLPYIQQRLGHESITTSVHVYGHLMPSAHVQMADSLGRSTAGMFGRSVVAPITLGEIEE